MTPLLYETIDAPDGPPPAKGQVRTGLTNAIRTLPEGKALVIKNGNSNRANGSVSSVRRSNPSLRYATRKINGDLYIYRLPDAILHQEQS